CAVVLEPIQGESGVLPADKAYLEGARRLCDQYGALLIFDEVQTGVGRTGELYAYQYFGVTPDILSSAKGLGGGFPIGAILTTSAIASHFGVGVHGTTYGGNPLGCAVGSAVLDVVNTPEVLAGIKSRHQSFKSELERIGQQYGLFEKVRGAGLLIGAVLAPAWKGRAKDIQQAAEREGVLVLQAGPDVIRLAPSLVISDVEMTEGLARFERAAACLAKS